MATLTQIQQQTDRLQRQIERRDRDVQRLQRLMTRRYRELVRLETRLKRVSDDIKACAVAQQRLRRRMARKELTQTECAIQVLKAAGKPLHRKEIIAAMQARGYVFASAAPVLALGVTLYSQKRIFRTVARGVFTLTERARR